MGKEKVWWGTRQAQGEVLEHSIKPTHRLCVHDVPGTRDLLGPGQFPLPPPSLHPSHFLSQSQPYVSSSAAARDQAGHTWVPTFLLCGTVPALAGFRPEAARPWGQLLLVNKMVPEGAQREARGQLKGNRCCFELSECHIHLPDSLIKQHFDLPFASVPGWEELHQVSDGCLASCWGPPCHPDPY